MMMKRKSNPWARLKYAYVLPLAAIAVAAFARPEVQNASSEISAVKVNDLVGNLVTNLEENFTLPDSNVQLPQDSIYEIVEVMPVFPGGDAGMMKFLQDNIKYPAEAQQAGASGRVLTRFIINSDGSISDVEIYKSVHPLLDAEALRVVSEMPNWTPGKVDGKAVKVRFTLPISFRLQGGESTPQNNAPAAKLSKAPEYVGGDKALYTFLAQNMKYPTDAQEAGIQGRAVVELTIAADGSMVNPHVTSSVHPLLEKEALRVVSMLQRWNPAVNENGQAVSATITLPFSFFVTDANGNITQRDKSVESKNEIIVVGKSI